MKKLKLFFALFAMLALGVGNAWGAETLYKTALFGTNYNSKKVSSYTTTWTATNDGFTVTIVNANNNNNGWAYIKMGRKSDLSTGSITTSNAIDKPISKITMTIDAVTAKNIKSIKLKTSTNGSSFTDAGSFTINKGDQSVTINNPTANLYYQIEVDCNTGSNGSIQISKVQYYATEDAGGDEGGSTEPAATLEQIAKTAGKTEFVEGEAFEKATITATYDDETTKDVTSLATFSEPNMTQIGEQTVSVSYTEGEVTAETSYTINITEKPKYTVTWKVNGEDYTTTQVAEGNKPTFPTTPESCDATSTTFYGWATEAWSGKINDISDKTIYTSASAMPAETATYHAVFCEGSGSTTLINETFDDSSTTDSNQEIGTTFSNFAGASSKAFKSQYGGVKFGNTSTAGYITSKSLDLSSPFTVTLDACKFGSDAGNIEVTVGAETKTINNSSLGAAGTFNTYTLEFDAATVTSTVKIATSQKRAYIDNVIIATKGAATNFITTCEAAPAPAVLVSIAANAEGKNEFTEGDAFEKATITATYDDETTKDVTSLATFTGYDMNTTGTQTVTVTYEDQTTTYQITVNAKTPATLTLSKNGVEEAFEGEHKVGDVVTLPSITSDCVKQFVGWSADANCATTPEYAPGADFTLTAEEHILYAVYATAAEGELTSIFSETFDACDGTGGNDGEWSGTVAQGDLPDELSSTWTFIKGTKANECAKFGTSSVKGSAETPAITLSGSAKLTFKSAAWDGSKEQTTLNVSATGATLSQTSVTLDKGSWNAYTIGITEATGSVKIKFEAVVDGNNRFFLDDVVVSQGSITYSDYSTTCAVAPDAPEFSVAAGTYNAAQTVTITAEDGATIYYTLDGNNPTNESTVYSSALTISETTTLKAIAVKDGLSSAITTATYTIKLPLTTIDQIFAKATEVGGTATAVEITMGGWTVSGANDKNVFVTDGTKGFIIYKSDEGHGFNVGDVLSGTVACKVQLFKGSAELTELTSSTSGLTVTTGGTVTPVTLNAAGITALTGVNTGSVIKINGTCTLENSKYYVAGVQLYNTLYEFQTLEPSAEYNVTGVYQLYTTTKEILPRQEADIEKIESLPTATISIADITMEVEETKTITATIYPAAAADAVVYSTTSSCISISGNTITGVTEGTATVTATIANADGEYYGTTKDFTVTVTPKSTKDKVVILAECDGQWYAMMAQYVSGKTSHLAALPVSYVGGKLYNIADADKTLIEWDRAVVDGKATFSNNSKYLTGKSDKTDLTLAATSCDWTISGESYLIGERTFFYNAENNWFRNFGTSNAGNKNYSGMPTVTAPVYATGDAYGRTVTTGAYGTICIPYGSSNYTGAEFYEIAYMELEDDGTTPKGIWLDQVNGALTAGKPYIFMATADEIAIVGDGTTAASPIAGEAGLTGTFTLIQDIATSDPSNTLEGNYMISGNQFLLCPAGCWLNANRAYIEYHALHASTTPVSPMPGRRRVYMGQEGENTETGVDNIITTDAPVKVIENGQLIIIRNGEKFNVQGQKL